MKPTADKVSVTERSLLVAYGHSQKLAAIRNRLQPQAPVEVFPLPEASPVADLKPEIATELNKARTLIDEHIEHIMRSFPEGKKKRLFAFRFGSVDAIKALSIKAAFKRLGMDESLVKMKLIADVDYYGHALNGR